MAAKRCVWKKKRDQFWSGKLMYHGYCETDTIRHRYMIRHTDEPGYRYRLSDDGGVLSFHETLAGAKREAKKRTGDH